jgi:mRNA interferase RelE/StbE
VRYKIEILRSAQKQLSKIQHQQQNQIIENIRKLSENPRPLCCKKLSGRPAWRIRIGDYRVIYEINDQRLLVLIITIGHRKDVYSREAR